MVTLQPLFWESMGTLAALNSGAIEDTFNIAECMVEYLTESDRLALADAAMYPQMAHNHFLLGLDGCVYRYSKGDYLCVSTNGDRWAPYIL